MTDPLWQGYQLSQDISSQHNIFRYRQFFFHTIYQTILCLPTIGSRQVTRWKKPLTHKTLRNSKGLVVSDLKEYLIWTLASEESFIYQLSVILVKYGTTPTKAPTQKNLDYQQSLTHSYTLNVLLRVTQTKYYMLKQLLNVFLMFCE